MKLAAACPHHRVRTHPNTHSRSHTRSHTRTHTRTHTDTHHDRAGRNEDATCTRFSAQRAAGPTSSCRTAQKTAMARCGAIAVYAHVVRKRNVSSLSKIVVLRCGLRQNHKHARRSPRCGGGSGVRRRARGGLCASPASPGTRRPRAAAPLPPAFLHALAAHRQNPAALTCEP